MESPTVASAMPHFSRTNWAIVWLAFIVILLPTLALPLGPDAAMFFVSAQKIIHQGAMHYRDIVDVKPPLIYYIYAMPIALLGDTGLSVRFFDLLMQVATLALLVRAVRRAGAADVVAAVAGGLYAMLYVGTGFSNTMQVESYFGILGLGTVLLMTARRRPWRHIAAGLLCGTAAMLKFPLGALLLAAIVAEITLVDEPLRNRMRNAALLAAGSAIVLALFLLYLTVGDAWGEFAAVNTFISGYARTTWSDFGMLRALWQTVPTVIAINVTLTVFVASAVATASEMASGSLRYTSGEGLLIRISSLIVALLALSIVVEGKFYAYQVSRLFPFVAILAAFVLVPGARALWQRRTRFNVVLIILTLPLIVLNSPVIFWLWYGAAPAALKLVSRTHYDAYFDQKGSAFPLRELELVGEEIRRRGGGDVFALSTVGALVHYHARSVPRDRIYHSAFLTPRFAPQQWRAEVRDRLLRERPRFIVVHMDDTAEQLTGEKATSADLIHRLRLDTVLAREFGVVLEGEHFRLYEMVSRRAR